MQQASSSTVQGFSFSSLYVLERLKKGSFWAFLNGVSSAMKSKSYDPPKVAEHFER